MDEHQCTCKQSGNPLFVCPLWNLLMTERKKQICAGVAILPEGQREAYLANWKAHKESGTAPNASAVVSVPRPVGPAPPNGEPNPLALGDMAEKALSAVGVTKERVSAWIGAPCGCGERQRKLNALGRWVAGFAKRTVDQAKEALIGIMDNKPPPPVVLDDAAMKALATAKVNPAWVQQWLAESRDDASRQRKMKSLNRWAANTNSGNAAFAKNLLVDLMRESK